ncbi:hypothetical protein HNY73_006507 [Argiope bruennichi]|uniref:Uncharacterized protein n=1 Tax=Argiope bruennichi TaxID=94029 RepID=A0A8T0FDS2_ARGBR|nr:hypothetical protein HNY73_006507 [Argiope bruennichi]
MVQRVGDNRRVVIAHMAKNLGISVSSAHSIVRHQMDYHKSCSRWVPYSLSSEDKGAGFAASLEFLQRYSSKGNDSLSCIITGDETRVTPFTQGTKQASMEWRHTSSPVRANSKVPQSTGKVMAAVSPIVKELSTPSLCRRALPLMLSRAYGETLRCLRKAGKNKRHRK